MNNQSNINKQIKNVVVIIADGMRPGNMSCYDYQNLTTPNLTSFADESVLFKDYYSCSNHSDSSFMTMFSGYYPRNHGIISHGSRISQDDLSKITRVGLLPEILNNNGFITTAISPIVRFPRAISDWHKIGYDHYYDVLLNTFAASPNLLRKIYRIPEILHLDKPLKAMNKKKFFTNFNAKLVTEKAIKFLRDNRSNNVFIFLDYQDVHPPYYSPNHFHQSFPSVQSSIHNMSLKEALDRYNDKIWLSDISNWLRTYKSVEDVLLQYDSAVAFIDHEIGRLFEALRTYNMFDNSIIIFTSDHGHSLGEHGIYFDHHGLYDVSIHVPFIIKSPGFPKGKRISGFTQHVDIVPTLLDILGITHPQMDGKSMIPLIKGEVDSLHSEIFAEEGCTEWKIALRDEHYKYIYSPDKEKAVCRNCSTIHGGLKELYDLDRDPEELNNILADKPGLAKNMEERLITWINSFKPIHFPVNLMKLHNLPNLDIQSADSHIEK